MRSFILISGMLLMASLMPAAALGKIVVEPSALHRPIGFVNADWDEFDEFEPAKPKEKPKKEKETVTTPESRPEKVSKMKAVALSILVPGAGQYYAGEKGRAEIFFGAEVLTWASWLGFHTYGKWKEDDYIRYAQQHAGIDPSGKDDEFFKNLTFYDNRYDYNTAGRIINPRAPYYPDTRSYYWQWDDDDSRSTYRNIRNASKTAFRKATFMIGVAVFNRIVSGIDAFRTASKVTQKVKDDEFEEPDSEEFKFKFRGTPFGDNPRFHLTVSRKF